MFVVRDIKYHFTCSERKLWQNSEKEHQIFHVQNYLITFHLLSKLGIMVHAFLEIVLFLRSEENLENRQQQPLKIFNLYFLT